MILNRPLVRKRTKICRIPSRYMTRDGNRWIINDKTTLKHELVVESLKFHIEKMVSQKEKCTEPSWRALDLQATLDELKLELNEPIFMVIKVAHLSDAFISVPWWLGLCMGEPSDVIGTRRLEPIDRSSGRVPKEGKMTEQSKPKQKITDERFARVHYDPVRVNIPKKTFTKNWQWETKQ